MLLSDLCEYLEENSTEKCKKIAVRYILGLPPSETLEYADVVESLIGLTSDDCEEIARSALLSLVNVYVVNLDGFAAGPLLKNSDFISLVVANVLDTENMLVDHWIMLLNNATRAPIGSDYIFVSITVNEIEKLYHAFKTPNYNIFGLDTIGIGNILCNLAQAEEGRQLFHANDNKIFRAMITLMHDQNTEIRSSVCGFIKNMHFDVFLHKTWYFPDDKTIKPLDTIIHILRRFIGPEKLDEKDRASLHPLIKDLPGTKERETITEIRESLIDALYITCATCKGREYLRSLGSYIILRELHMVETVEYIKSQTEYIIGILIRDEDDIGVDNLINLQIPTEVLQALTIADEATTEITTEITE